VYATANGVTSLPPEILRKGRFDEMFSVSLPDAGEREEILGILVEKRGRKGIAKRLMLGSVAELSEGFTGAELEGALDAAMFSAFDGGQELSTDDIQTAVRNTVPLSKTMERQIREVEEWCKGRTVPAGRRESVEKAVFETGSHRVVSV
jgi:SpoVK/Ycf46/Vps4 family AAA+-type ATPase